MADQLTDDQIEELKNAFNTFDTDGSGTITSDELGNVMSSLGQNASEEELQQFVQQVGGDDGKVHWDQFVTFMAQLLNSQ